MTSTYLTSTTDSPYDTPSALEQGLDYLQTLPISAMLGPMFRRFGLQSIYVLTGFPIALMAFVATVIGLSLGTGLVIVMVGIPILVATLLMTRVFAWIERFRLVRLMGYETS